MQERYTRHAFGHPAAVPTPMYHQGKVTRHYQFDQTHSPINHPMPRIYRPIVTY